MGSEIIPCGLLKLLGGVDGGMIIYQLDLIGKTNVTLFIPRMKDFTSSN